MARIVDLNAQRIALENYTHLSRGDYRTVCVGLYRIARELVVSILNDHNDIQTDCTDTEMFDAVVRYHPEFTARLTAVRMLRGFLDGKSPFDPQSPDALTTVIPLRDDVQDLLTLAINVHQDPSRSLSRDLFTIIIDKVEYDFRENDEEVQGNWTVTYDQTGLLTIKYDPFPDSPFPASAAQYRVTLLNTFTTVQCECVTDCAEDPATACSLSGQPHVHPELGRCPAHPDAPGDWLAGGAQ